MSKKIRALLSWTPLVVYCPVLFIATHIPTLTTVQIYGRDATLHLLAYLTLTLLYWLARYGKTRPSGRTTKLYLTIAIVACYAALDEISQSFVHRQCDFYDWLSDMAGCLTALALLYFLRRWWHWLTLYWIGHFVLTHWPQKNAPFMTLPPFLQQFQVAIIMTAYLILTLLWWRSLSDPRHCLINKKILTITVTVLPCYALFDGLTTMLMGRFFDGADFFSAFAGIGVGVLCAAALARHHLVAQINRKTSS